MALVIMDLRWDTSVEAVEFSIRSGLVIAPQAEQAVHVRPHDFDITKSTQPSAATAILKDWQHLGALIRLELVKQTENNTTETLYAELPNEQFKQLQVSIGEAVELRIRHAHWFHNAELATGMPFALM